MKQSRIILRQILCLLFLFLNGQFVIAQVKATDANAPLHTLQPDYVIPYKVPSIPEIITQIEKVYQYLNTVTPPVLVNKQTGKEVGFGAVDTNTILKVGDFRLTSYEWGVTYAGMLALGKATGDTKFTRYTLDRVQFLAEAYPSLKALYQKYPVRKNPLSSVIDPHALDDAGAICAAIIKSIQSGGNKNLTPLADNFLNFISTKQQRFADGTLARSRPQPNTLWLDDLFMSVPALAQAGKWKGDQKYFDDAVKQVLQFSERMFNKEKNVYMHGWSASMTEHPQFHWARANGWAIMTIVELLDVLPADHPSRNKILSQLKLHAKGLAAYQTNNGFWHQLLDRNDSYLETSATAIYCYSIAKAVNSGWLDAKAYTPLCILAWNAVTTKINTTGQVEGVCVGTGMAFDPAFYYYRPTNVYAAHGYGPVLLAGAEMINLVRTHKIEMDDSAIQVRD